MLQLKTIYKSYITKNLVVRALKNINLSFRKAEYVAVLGASGCGKTTLLNIIGGLDKYSKGDITLYGKSTQNYKNSDWDTYRNKQIGFVFQNYNLIQHQNILSNVELALTLAGVDALACKRLALEALTKVGLKNEATKYPNQLSGGQMQRVAIARAIVNNPNIILADEPTGALDSESSKMVCDLLKEISKERLVIMVTHNAELAETYATRIIKMKDSVITEDSNPYEIDNCAKSNFIDITYNDEKYSDNRKSELSTNLKLKPPKTSLKFITACKFSIKNLMTKKLRTALTSIAGAIGIIGIALVMAVSNGVETFMVNTQSDTLSSMPISINTNHVKLDNLLSSVTGMTGNKDENYPDDDKLIVDDPIDRFFEQHYNRIDKDYINYLNNIDTSLVNDVHYTYATSFNLISKTVGGGYKLVDVGKKFYSSIDTGGGMADALANIYFTLTGSRSARMYEMVKDEYLQSQYEVIEGKYPTEKNEIAVIVNRKNAINADVVNFFGFDLDKKDLKLSDLTSQTLSLVNHNDYYEPYKEFIGEDKEFIGEYKELHLYRAKNKYQQMYSSGMKLKVTAVMRVKENISSEMFDTGILYRPELTEYFMQQNSNADIVTAQKAQRDYDVITGKNYEDVGVLGITKEDIYSDSLKYLGAIKSPSDIYIYSKDLKSKESICKYLSNYNIGKKVESSILYNDPSQILTSSLSSIVQGVSIALVCLAAVSLLVSMIMIAIVTYVSVLERTKEIGVLRALGAKKIDISMLFNTETAFIGLFSGVVGVGVAWLLTLPFNAIINSIFDGVAKINLLVLNPIVAVILLFASMILTLVAGLIPSYLAAKKDPVKALRME